VPTWPPAAPMAPAAPRAGAPRFSPPFARPAVPPPGIPERRVSPRTGTAEPGWPAWPTSGAPAAPAPPRGGPPAPSGDSLRAFLQDGISGLRRLEDQPFSPPANVPDEDTVPIEQLLYRGRAALERAVALRKEWAREGAPPSNEAMQELFDLLDLALVD